MQGIAISISQDIPRYDVQEAPYLEILSVEEGMRRCWAHRNCIAHLAMGVTASSHSLSFRPEVTLPMILMSWSKGRSAKPFRLPAVTGGSLLDFRTLMARLVEMRTVQWEITLSMREVELRL